MTARRFVIIVALAVLGVIALVQFRPNAARRRAAWTAVALFAAGAALGLAWLAWEDVTYGLFAQAFARNHALLVSLPLAAAAFGLVLRPDAVRWPLFRQAAALCAVLAVLGGVNPARGRRIRR